jgi:VWFA-related protein
VRINLSSIVPLLMLSNLWGQTKPAELMYLDVTLSNFSSGEQPMTAKDFEISADGKAQVLDNAAFIDTSHKRTLVFVVDDLGLSPEGISSVQRVLRKFVSEQVQPDDRIAIVGTGIHTAPGLTSGRSALNSAIDRIGYHALEDSRNVRPATFISGTLPELAFVMNALAKTPGRKSVVLFSERVSLPRGAGPAIQSEAEASTSRIARLAGQAMAVFYCIPVSAVVNHPASDGIPRLQTGLAAVVSETGGLWIDGAPDLSQAFDSVLQEQDGYYRIAFRPAAHAYDYASGRNLVDKIAVKTARPGVRVRSRTVVFAVSDESTPPFPPDVGDEDRESTLNAAFDGSAIGLDASYTFYYSASEGPYLEVLMRIDSKNLTYVKELSGEYKCILQISSLASGGDGQSAGESSRGVAYSLTEPQYRSALAAAIVYTQKLPISKPGAYQIRSFVADGPAGRLGSAGRYMEIPDVKKGDLALSGIVNQAGTSSVRIFRPGSTFAYTYQIYNLTVNGEKRSEVEIQSRLLRGGREVFAGKPTPIVFDRNAKPGESVVNGTLSLGPDMTPGRYILVITATDKLAGKPRSASQYIDLEVRP